MCEACHRLMGWTIGTEPNHERQVRAMATIFGDNDLSESLGAHMVSNVDLLNPEYMPDYESAVPGWKTLGAT